MDTLPQDDFFNQDNMRYLDMPVSPIHPEAIAKLIKEIHGSIQPRMPSNRGPRSEKLFDVVSKARSNPNISILPEKLGWHGIPKDEFKLQFFSNKDTREKLITAYNGLKSKKHPKPATKSKELDLFEEIPEDLKFYDECYLKMANLANVEGLEKLFEPNFALNAYYFVTISDSPGYACYILNYCIKNLSSHIPVGWLLPASENKRELDTTKFCECSDIPEGDMEMNVRIGETFDFKDEESFKQWAEEVLQGTENEEGVSLVLSAFTSKQRTLQLKEKEMQRHIFKAILAASYVLADNGHLIIKLYTVFQRMSIELMFLLFALFEDFRIVKPNSSHPKKLERFAICSKFRQSMGKDLRENLLKMLPHIASDEFMKQDGSIIDLNTVMAAKDFNKFIDAMNTTTMQKLKSELDNQRPRKIDPRQTKRLLGKWKLIQISESDQSDEGSPPRGGQRNYQGGQSYHNPRQYGGDHRGGYRDNYRDNRNNNYHRDRDDRNNDRRDDRRDYRDRDNSRPRGGGDRGGRGGDRGGRGGDRGFRGGRGRGGYDRDRGDRHGGDRDNRRHHDSRDSRDSRDRDRDRDRSRDYGRRNDNQRPPDFEKIEVRAKDVLNKEMSIPSFDIHGFLGTAKK